MAFLTLNGITVDVAHNSGNHKPRVTGQNEGTVYGAAPARDRQSNRRTWEFETKPLTDTEAEGLIGLIQGRGQSFPYDDSLVSDGGRSPTGTAVATLIPGQDQQTSPAEVYLESSGEKEAMFWGDSLEMGPGATNLLSVDSSNAENAPTGYVARVGGTPAAETTIVLAGSKSLKVTTSASTNSGISCTDITSGITPGNNYTLSVYVYTATSYAITVRLFDGIDNTAVGFTPTAGVWNRVVVTHTMNGAATYLRPQVYKQTASAGSIFYCDNFQVEAGTVATPWTVGQSTRAAPSLKYEGITNLSDNLTFAAWVRPPATNPSANVVLFRCEDSTESNTITLQRISGTNNLTTWLTTESVVGTGTNNYASSPWDDGWHHVALVFASRMDGNVRTLRMYYDGVAVVENDSVTAYPELRGKASDCFIGNNDGATPWQGPIQEVLVLPYALDADHIAGLAARTRRMPGLPLLDAQGEFVHALSDGVRNENFPVLGKVTNAQYAGRVRAGSYKSYNRIVSFQLDSVDEV